MTQELSADEKATVARIGIHDVARGVVMCVRRDDPMWDVGARALTYAVVDGVASNPTYFRTSDTMNAWEAAMCHANALVEVHRNADREVTA